MSTILPPSERSPDPPTVIIGNIGGLYSFFKFAFRYKILIGIITNKDWPNRQALSRRIFGINKKRVMAGDLYLV
jgi:hypothetical protein